jgi:hypothetical protein
MFSFHAGKQVNYTGEPLSTVFVPVLDSFDERRKTVAVIGANLRWDSYFENILTASTPPVRVVLSNTCQDIFTYEIRGTQATFVGKGNLAHLEYEDMAISVDLDETRIIVEPNTIALTLNQDICRYTLRIYPTPEGDDYHNNAFPLIITLTVAAVFLMTAAVFYFYDVMVERRQKVVLDTAQRSTAIVSSIFPKNVRDQLLQAPVQGNATKLRFLADARKQDNEAGISSPANVDVSSGPIADLFPNCTGELDKEWQRIFHCCGKKTLLTIACLSYPTQSCLRTWRASPHGRQSANRLRSSRYWRLYTPLLIVSPYDVEYSRSRQWGIVMSPLVDFQSHDRITLSPWLDSLEIAFRNILQPSRSWKAHWDPKRVIFVCEWDSIVDQSRQAYFVESALVFSSSAIPSIQPLV